MWKLQQNGSGEIPFCYCLPTFVPNVLCFLLNLTLLVLNRDTSAVLFVAIVVDHDIFYRLDVRYFLPNSRFNLSEVVSLSDLNVGFESSCYP